MNKYLVIVKFKYGRNRHYWFSNLKKAKDYVTNLSFFNDFVCYWLYKLVN